MNTGAMPKIYLPMITKTVKNKQKTNLTKYELMCYNKMNYWIKITKNVEKDDFA